MNTYIIAAVSRCGAIGQGGKLPWPPLTADMRWFHRITRALDPALIAQEMIRAEHIGSPTVHNALIMGRRTWESLGSKSLPFRAAWILGQDCPLPWALEQAATYCCPNAFICGGARAYGEGLERTDVRTAFITEIDAEFPAADTYFPGAFYGCHSGPAVEGWQQVGSLAWTSARGLWQRADVGPWIAEHGLRYRLTIWRKADAPERLS